MFKDTLVQSEQSNSQAELKRERAAKARDEDAASVHGYTGRTQCADSHVD